MIASAAAVIAMLRPTASTGLYIQMAGRGMRVAPGKDDCLVLDFAGNVMRHGPVDAIALPEDKKGGKGDGEAAEPPARSVPAATPSCRSARENARIAATSFLRPSRRSRPPPQPRRSWC